MTAKKAKIHGKPTIVESFAQIRGCCLFFICGNCVWVRCRVKLTAVLMKASILKSSNEAMQGWIQTSATIFRKLVRNLKQLLL